MDAQELLRRRRDRAIAIILGVKDRELDPVLPTGQQGDKASRMIRKVVLDQFNDFYDFCLDIVQSSEASTMVFNDTVWEDRLRKIDRLLDAVADADMTEIDADGFVSIVGGQED